MFTGIIQRVGTVERLDDRPFGVRLVIEPGAWDVTPRAGDSIAIDGCCLTLVEGWTPGDGPLAFDCVRETLEKTALGDRATGDRVNLEPAMRASDRLDGHMVQGHIEGVGTVAAIQDDPSDWRMTVRTPADLMPCVVPKGSVTIDGVSLTVASIENDTFTVALIPTTLERTTFRDRRVGDRVNLETDILARTVLHQLRTFAPQLLDRPAE